MPRIKMRYISGFQGVIKQEHLQYLEAESLEAALRTKSDWPIEYRFNGTSAWALNPGTSLYYVEAWEADFCDEDGKSIDRFTSQKERDTQG